MTTNKPQENYDYTATKRKRKQREDLIASGGARIDAEIDADGVGRLDALIKSGKVTSRKAAVAYAVKQLPDPEQ